MLNSYGDKQFIDMKRLDDVRPPDYSDPTKYMNDPGAVCYEMKGRVRHNAMSTADQVALTQFYIKEIPAIAAIWHLAVGIFMATHTPAQIRDAGICRPQGRLGFQFQTATMMYSFFNMEIAGE